MTPFGLPLVHTVFDVLAWLASMATFWLVTRRLVPHRALPHPALYALSAGAGALLGALVFGTANALLSGETAIGFSMVGGLAGAIAAVEAYKRLAGLTGSTGIAFAASFCITVAVGRLGCFFAGLPVAVPPRPAWKRRRSRAPSKGSKSKGVTESCDSLSGVGTASATLPRITLSSSAMSAIRSWLLRLLGDFVIFLTPD